MVQVVHIEQEMIRFSDGSELSSYHSQDCCEHHYLDFTHHALLEFEGLEFDLSSPAFFEKVEDYGIRLLPTNGHPISIPGYGFNNGYYSANLTLLLTQLTGTTEFDISDCQDIRD